MSEDQRVSKAGDGGAHDHGEPVSGGPSSHAEGDASEEHQAERLLPLVYHELRRIASSMLGSGPALTIQPTALVHEAFLKLSREEASHWNDESHFRAVASIAMRRILADHARTRGRIKRGGPGAKRVDLTLCSDSLSLTHADPADLHEALRDLEAANPRVAKLVVYRFFGDLDVVQAAERLGVSVSTAEADWRFARAWLKRRLSDAGDANGKP